MPHSFEARRVFEVGAAVAGGLGLLAVGTPGHEQTPAAEQKTITVASNLSEGPLGVLAINGCIVKMKQPLGQECPLPKVEIEYPPSTFVTGPSQAELAAQATATTRPKAPPVTRPVPPPEASRSKRLAAAPPKGPVLDAQKTAWLNEAGVAPSDHDYVDDIFTPESNWRPDAVSKNGCIGLGQNCPQKGRYWLKEACPNWQHDVICQIRRFARYAIERYGSWAKALRARNAQGWW